MEVGNTVVTGEWARQAGYSPFVPAPSTPPGVVVVFGDLGCPWASLIVFRLRRRRRELGLDGQVVLDHRALPRELVHRRPTPRVVLDAETAVVSALEPGLGWQPWQRPDHDHPVSTLLPLQVVQAAKAEAVGGLPASEQLDARLRHAWYGESRPVHRWSEILAVAQACASVDVPALQQQLRAGRGQDEMFAQWEQARLCGATASPHVFTTDGWGAHNPGLTVDHVPQTPVVLEHDVTVIDDVLRRAGRLQAA